MRIGSIVAIATLTLLTAACGKSEKASPAATVVAPEPTEAEKLVLLASFAVPYNTADVANGQAKFALCQSCHTITPGGAKMTGPNLHGVLGKTAASNPDFKYSDALKAAGWVWDADKLNQWLAEPKTFLPGTKMSFAGLSDAKDRTDLIAYLMVETGHKP